MKIKKIALLVAVSGVSAPAFATNGMNLAGYGPISESMGGVSAAYDNGNAAMINNPATLGFMASGTARFDVALGDLMPKVTSQGQDSTAKDFFMPAIGYVRKDGNLSWGAGIIPQGGMGTDYNNGQFWGTLQAATAAPSIGAAQMSAGQALRNMSEVGVGRVMFPLAYSVNENLNIGGSIDYVWAGMDVKWMMDGKHMFDMMTGPTAVGAGARQTFGRLSGSLQDFFDGAFGVALNNFGWGYFDFERGGKFNQQAKGSGWAGNIGFTYRASPQLTIGAVYHAKTHLSDLDTGSNKANVNFQVGLVAGNTPFLATTSGRVVVHNFQWPETYSFGLAYQASNAWMLAADYKRINWSGVMKNLDMTYTVETDNSGFGLTGKQLNVQFFQNWKNQDVLQLGAQYKYSDALTLRFGTNIANNPIPDQFVSPLFPAIYKTHYTFGFGYLFSKASSFDFSYVHTPKVSVTNNWGSVGGSNQNVSVSGGGWTAMYSYRF